MSGRRPTNSSPRAAADHRARAAAARAGLAKYGQSDAGTLVCVSGGAGRRWGCAAGQQRCGRRAGERKKRHAPLVGTARREPEQEQEAALEIARSELRAKEEQLVRNQGELTQREAAFAQTRASLDHALASSQQARESLEQQVTALAAEGLRQREVAAREVARHNALLDDTHAAAERLRQEGAMALAQRELDRPVSLIAPL